jgi:hypothetical protein
MAIQHTPFSLILRLLSKNSLHGEVEVSPFCPRAYFTLRWTWRRNKTEEEEEAYIYIRLYHNQPSLLIGFEQLREIFLPKERPSQLSVTDTRDLHRHCRILTTSFCTYIYICTCWRSIQPAIRMKLYNQAPLVINADFLNHDELLMMRRGWTGGSHSLISWAV